MRSTIDSRRQPRLTTSSVLWPDHCVQNTLGCELIPELDKTRLDMVIEKGQDSRVESYSGFGPPFLSPQVAMTGLEETLRKAGIAKVFVVGLAWDYCVKYTAMDAAKAGFETFVIEEATKAVNQSEQAAASLRQEMLDAGVHHICMDSDELHVVETR